MKTKHFSLIPLHKHSKQLLLKASVNDLIYSFLMKYEVLLVLSTNSQASAMPLVAALRSEKRFWKPWLGMLGKKQKRCQLRLLGDSFQYILKIFQKARLNSRKKQALWGKCLLCPYLKSHLFCNMICIFLLCGSLLEFF